MVEYADRLAAAMKAAGGTTSWVARELGLSYQAVKKVLDGKSQAFTAANNDAAARLLDVSPSWLATGRGGMRDETGASALASPANGRVAQPVSQAVTNLPTTTSWEAVMDREKMPVWPDEITVVVPDKALEPHVMSGDHLTFEACDSAETTSVVVIETPDGKRWIRRLVKRADGSLWGAVEKSKEDAFPAFPATKILARATRRSSPFNGF